MKEYRSQLREIIDWIFHMAGAIVLALLIVKFIGQPTIVSGSSMNPTLSDGDFLVIEKLSQQFGTIQSGDIVVLEIPELLSQGKKYAIKRVIATGGSTVEIRDGKVFVEFSQIDEHYLEEDFTESSNPNGDKVFVPEGSIFVLGDNRKHNASRDSRVFGVVDENRVVGKAVFRLLPMASIGSFD